MPEYVTRHEFAKHIEESDEGFRRLESLEAEIMGDPRTGRASLRLELTGRMDEHQMMIEESDRKTEKSLSFIKRIAVGVLIAVIVAVIVNAFGLKESLSKKSAEQSQSESPR